jgi:hypothetical protein
MYKRTRKRNTNKVKQDTQKACSYKKAKGSISVSNFLKCIQIDVLRTDIGHPKHIYEINDNAAFPFVVFDYGGGRASIYNNRFNEESNRGELSNKLMDVKYEQIFPGDNGMNDKYWRFKRGVERGNNILFQTGKGKYIFVGKGIHSFSSINGDTIRNFYSPMGGNYDSFPYAVGDKYVYLLNEHKYAPIGEFDEKRDAIRQYYCYDTTECKKYKTVSLPMKILYKPLHGYYL